MFTEIKNITLTLLILAIGLGQPLASSLDVIDIYEVEAADEKEVELKEAAKLFNSQEEKTSVEPYYHDFEAQLASYIPTCHSESAFISTRSTSLYLLYDTFLV